jgi:hypothetical protein
MSDDWIDYPARLRRALGGMVRELLVEVAGRGLAPPHELFLALRTDHPGVELPDAVRAQYPEEITIVLRPRYYDGLVVEADAFRVSLQFGPLPARVRVPFAALVRFVDPAVQFGVELGPVAAGGDGEVKVEAAAPAPAASSEPGADGEGGGDGRGGDGNVVAFDRRPRPRGPEPG